MLTDACPGHDPTKPRTIFDIETCRAWRIHDFSAYGEDEMEVIFAPLAMFRVKAVSKVSSTRRDVLRVGSEA